jgi:Flp pilus assembly protein TadG
MRLRPNRRAAQRSGMTIVESTLVLAVFCLLMFGIFEYSRFLYVLHVTNNAARDGARYAVVNMDKPTNFDTTDFTDAQGIVYPSIQRYTNIRMAGTGKQLFGYTNPAVFAVDSTGLTLTPPIIRPKTSSAATPPVYPDPYNPNDPNKVPWNQAAFTDGIAVRIEGDYHPFLPSFLTMSTAFHVSITAIANSEG